MLDLLVRNGRVIDPATNTDTQMDLGFRDGRIVSRGPSLTEAAKETVDATDWMVSPGWIDLHVHVYPGGSHYGVDPDPTCLARGVTTALDAGSAGAANFGGLRRFIIERSATRLFALLNISRIGLIVGVELDPPMGELEDLRHLSVPALVRCVEANRDVIVGVKVRLSANLAADGQNEPEGLKRAREAADAVNLPLMIHHPKSSLGLPTILAQMRSGDILTHCFHGHTCGPLQPDGTVLPEVHQAIARGVLFDVGHGRGSFSYEVTRKALSQGVLPHIISSDLHSYNVQGPVYDLATTASKFLHLGMSLSEVLERITSRPAQALGKQQELGTLAVGAAGDAVCFRLSESERKLADTMGNVEIVTRWFDPLLVIRAGQVVHRAQGVSKIQP